MNANGVYTYIPLTIKQLKEMAVQRLKLVPM